MISKFQSVMTFCPKCHEYTFKVAMEKTGKCEMAFGTSDYFEGNGKCRSCKYKGYYKYSPI